MQYESGLFPELYTALTLQKFPYVLLTLFCATLVQGDVSRMRAVNRTEGYITYTLNILGLQVFEGSCRLLAKHAGAWVAIGDIRALPLHVPKEVDDTADPLLLTIHQYSSTFPSSDLRDLVEGRLPFANALEDDMKSTGAGG